jgi:hypothetical protein
VRRTASLPRVIADSPRVEPAFS